MNHLKNHFRLCYKRVYNNYCYAHFYPAHVVHFDRLIQQLTRTQNWQSVAEDFNTWREMVLASNNAEIWIKGLNNLDDLNRDEHIKFNMIAGSFIWTCWFVYHLQINEGFLVDANNTIYRDLYKHEGYRSWLIYNEKLHTDEFGDFLQEVKKSVGSERYTIGESSSLTAGIY